MVATVEQVHSTLDAFDVDVWLIEKILGMLGESEREVARGCVRTNAEGAFGSAATAQVLSWDAGVAHAKVAEAMAEMVAGLGAYAASIRSFRDDATRTDEEAGSSLAALTAVTDQVSTPTIAAASENGVEAGSGS